MNMCRCRKYLARKLARHTLFGCCHLPFVADRHLWGTGYLKALMYLHEKATAFPAKLLAVVAQVLSRWCPLVFPNHYQLPETLSPFRRFHGPQRKFRPFSRMPTYLVKMRFDIREHG